MGKLLIICLSMIGFTLSAKCPSIRLDKYGPLSKMKVWTQPCDFGICYAIAATQLLDSWLIHNEKVAETYRSSPVALAILSALHSKKESLDYSHSEKIFDAMNAKKRQPCEQAKLLEVMKEKFGLSGLTGFQNFVIRKLKQEVNGLDIENKITKAMTLLKERYRDIANFDSSIPKLKEFLENALKNNEDNALINFLDDVVKNECKDISLKINFPLPKIAVKTRWMNQEFKDHIINALLLGTVGLGYCVEMLNDKKFAFLDSVGNRKIKQCGINDMNLHASIIVGSRPQTLNPDKCDFLIRDSSGESCLPNRPWSCEKGQYWVSEDNVINNSLKIFYIND